VRKRKTQDTPSERLVLDRFLPYRIAVLARSVSNALGKLYQSTFDISIPEWRVIAHLAEVQNCSSGDIVARTAMDHAKVNRAVTRLTARALIIAGISEKDRRVNVLSLSPTGRDVYDKIAPMALSYQNDLISVLTPEEQEALTALLIKLQERSEHLAHRGSTAE